VQPLQANPKEMVMAEPTNNRTAGIDTRDGHWTRLGLTGSCLCQILLNLDWIQTVNCFINLVSGPDVDRVNRK